MLPVKDPCAEEVGGQDVDLGVAPCPPVVLTGRVQAVRRESGGAQRSDYAIDRAGLGAYVQDHVDVAS
ncbi:MAG: hypothetical protein ACTH1T_09960 [Brachybacterium tyrofermentans]